MLKQMLNIIFGRANDNSTAPSMDGALAMMDAHAHNFAGLIEAAPESKPRTPFDAGLPRNEMAMANLTPRQKMRVIPKMVPLLLNMYRSALAYDKPFTPTKHEVTPEFLAQLEAKAKQWGVQDIGYVKVPRNAIFQDKGIPYEYAIVYTVKMDKEPIDTAPSFDCQEEVMRGYKNMAVIGTKMARMMHREGFAAYSGTALGGSTDYVYLAELAGLGAIGYHGLLISPTEGARLRINTIYTNITNLPIQAENEHLWVRDFCAMCKKCVRKCPVSAIYEQPVPRGDGGMQSIDHATCRDYFARNFGCGVCLAQCPFSQVGYETVKARFKGNPDAPQWRIPVESDVVPIEAINID
jgi:epoxyqueuosine reductase